MVNFNSEDIFICDFCGEKYSGEDFNLQDLSLVTCENGHIFHEKEMLKHFDWWSKEGFEFLLKQNTCSEMKKFLRKCIQNNDYSYDDCIADYIWDINRKVPVECCPVCDRLRRMKQNIKYNEYMALYEMFEKVLPDGRKVF